MNAGLPLAATLLLAAALAQAAPADFVDAQQRVPLLAHATNPRSPDKPWLRVDVAGQWLTLYDADGTPRRHYRVSTASNGVGETEGSYQTPRGWHVVCDKIGDDAPADTIIYRQQITDWRYTPALHAQYPDKDWILTRILWLCGVEPGRNQGERDDGTVVDSYRRFIYIHGAGDHVPWGTPSSKGCVRMSSPDVIDLYRIARPGLEVLIDAPHDPAPLSAGAPSSDPLHQDP